MKTLYKNAKIFTANDEALYADAMLVEDGVIAAIGEESQCGQADEMVDLGGKRVLPGLIDAHMHGLMLAGYSQQISALPPKINSIADLSEAIKEVAATKEPGDWIRGWGFDEGKFAEHRQPTRWDLDKGTTQHPVYILRSCVHIACVNSCALDLAGITKDTPDPEGGCIVRDENGEPTGILEENARFLVADLIPIQTDEETVQQVLDLGELCLSQGLVAFTDLGWFEPSDPLNYYKQAIAKGLKQDVAVYYLGESLRDGTASFEIEDLNQGKVHVAGLKLIGDGTFSGHTAWVDEPFLGTDNYGISTLADDLLEDTIKFCKEHHCQISIHAMGGQAIDRLVSRLAEEDDWMDSDVARARGEAIANMPYARMEHISEPRESSIDKAIEHGITWVTQPIFQHSEIESYIENLGFERNQKAYPVKHMLERGVKVVLSTDAPATSWALPSDPWPGLKHAVTRVAYDGTDCGKDQAIDIETAIKLYSREAAIVCGFDRLGQLKEGYRASFLVMEDDVLEVPAEKIGDVRVAATYIDGEKCYSLN